LAIETLFLYELKLSKKIFIWKNWHSY